MNTINVSLGDTVSAIEVEDGVTLLEAVSRIDDLHLDAPCGGKGTCGKCKVRILNDGLSIPSEKEMEFLSTKEKSLGYRLACMIEVVGDMDVHVDDLHDKSQILTSHHGFTGDLNPLIHKKYLTLPKPSLKDQRDDLSRILESIPLNNAAVSLPLRKKIPNLLQDAEYAVTAVYSSDTLISVEPGNTESSNYGIAIDIGTTTVAAYLLDIKTGKIIDTVSGLNSQKIFGADVISRIEISMQGSEKLKMLQDKILSTCYKK